MCGIAGALRFGIRASEEQGERELESVVREMAASIVHRGPDDSGLRLVGSGAVALAHRRLSIVDLSSTGHQPMTRKGGNLTIVFNGEIYNFRQIRSELQGLGIAFEGTSDTEVILAACEQWGIRATLKRLTGMFAFALWDEARRKLFLARDRLGEKPLHFGLVGRTLYFGSELRCFYGISGLSSKINADAVDLYLVNGYVPAPHSMLEGVVKLPAGCVLELDQRFMGPVPKLRAATLMDFGTPEPSPLQVYSYWGIDDVIETSSSAPLGVEAEALEMAEGLLLDAVRDQAECDVEIGAFLSGGVDSALVAAILKRVSSEARTFTIAFDGRFNEGPAAQAIAAHLGTNHLEIPLSSLEVPRLVPSLAPTQDEPTASATYFASLLVARIARQHVKVVLTGDGGDEIFGGYNRYGLCESLWPATRRMPRVMRTVLGRRFSHLPTLLSRIVNRAGDKFSSTQAEWSLRVEKALRVCASESPMEAYRRLMACTHDLFDADRDASFVHHPRVTSFLREAMRWDQMHYLPDDNLARVDRASMATGLETRAPLLDYRLLELSWRLPDSMLVRDSQRKWILRRLLSKYLPRELIDKPKMGFTAPVKTWLTGPLREWSHDILLSSGAQGFRALEKQRVSALLDQFKKGRYELAQPLWALCMLASWVNSARKKE